MASSNPLIRLESVKFRWREQDNAILDIPTFEVDPGERVFIRGASGSGKTTLLSLIGGVITPQQGTVGILGTAVNHLQSAQRDAFRAAHIGFIFQMFNLIPYLSLLENVVLPCRFSRTRRNRALTRSRTLEAEANRLLAHLGLAVDSLPGRTVTELSVGQQQRVAAARALIGNPELIIADEPTSALDSDIRRTFLELLFKEAEAVGATLLFVSHDASLQPLFDRSLALADVNRAALKSGT
ncbi:MAG: ABC transporter ATP-binding protein [Candidatus Competibacteraceae bacterium]|jgi:putative ABC transport system ATP-binding protein|nr:ABC transporter ATP-binding protein [Candidatus Competibacteraceae bacterium]